MVDVFISYKREDRSVAERVQAKLLEEGWTTWLDSSVAAGDHWNESINIALDKAKCVVVLWSEASFASRWVQAEAHSGFERDILVAARIDAVALKPPFNIVQTADLREQAFESGLDELLKGVQRKAGPSSQGAKQKPSPASDRPEAKDHTNTIAPHVTAKLINANRVFFNATAIISFYLPDGINEYSIKHTNHISFQSITVDGQEVTRGGTFWSLEKRLRFSINLKGRAVPIEWRWEYSIFSGAKEIRILVDEWEVLIHKFQF